ncbi:nucleotidyltransferase domain-containing protein [Exiguobacterium aurantiacum]|uniref:Nucleotidyltransferase domain-containing protein n=1 Tax=Exiguobacterium aurantiacum TaxID=33987 RepID=A0ABY5FLT2_9BACL|nr:nucleotidyltransferase domain-containing protein [Exiguobacterium aurantiacum]UTT42560.1 nucleotidyltransferase domain-containing protein [Exiguobacterium aurantiacum]
MELPTRLGTDETGYVINQTDVTRIQPMFRQVIDEVIQLLREEFAEALHSVYVYGSVGRGTAVAGQSDLDVTVIVKREVDVDVLKRRSMILLQEHPEVIKIDYDIGLLDTVLEPTNHFEWGFWLRHMCACVDGTDLSHRFPYMKPDGRTSRALNRDLSDQLREAQVKLKARCMTGNEKRSLVKRMIRGAYLTINVDDQSFVSTIADSLFVLRLYFPNSEIIDDLERGMESEEIQDDWLGELIVKYESSFLP